MAGNVVTRDGRNKPWHESYGAVFSA